MHNRPKQQKCEYKKIKELLIITFCWIIYPAFSNAQNDEVLLTIHDRDISTSEFIYSFQKNFHKASYQNIDIYLEQFIDFHLKITQARQEGLDRNITFKNELTDYRIKLAAPYLTHKEKEEELAREVYEHLFYEVNASHILVKINSENNPQDTLQAYNKAIQLRESIVRGEPFDQIARSFSDDSKVEINSGSLGYITAFQTEYRFETAVFNMNPGELSMPIMTSNGYHIIQCHDKRLIDNQNISSYDQKKEEIKGWIKEAKDFRTEIIRNAFMEELKKEWNFVENRYVLESLYSIAEEKIFKGDWKIPASLNPDRVLCTIDSKDLTLKDFVDFISNHETNSGIYSIKEYINLLYNQFVSTRLLKYENYKLEEKYPEFRYQFWEYRNAMLLLEITNRQVWLKSTSDSSGLADFFVQNKDKYMWGERLVAGIYSTTDKQTAVNAAKTALKSHRGRRSDINWASNFTTESNDHLLTEQQDTFSHGDHPLIDQVNWKKGVVGVIDNEDNYQFVVVYDLLKPSFRTLSEAQGMVLADYQSHLMKTWIKDLRSKYQIQIKREVLLSVKEALSE